MARNSLGGFCDPGKRLPSNVRHFIRLFTCPKSLAFKRLLNINILDRRIQEEMLVLWV